MMVTFLFLGILILLKSNFVRSLFVQRKQAWKTNAKAFLQKVNDNGWFSK